MYLLQSFGSLRFPLFFFFFGGGGGGGPLTIISLGYSKGRFTRYNFVACDMLTTSLRHELFHVNQTYNLLTIVVYDTKNVVGF